MSSRLCTLLTGVTLLAAACSGSTTVPTATDAPAAPADTSASETPDDGTTATATSTTPTGATAAAGGTAAPPTTATPGKIQLDPRETGALRNHLGFEFPPAPEVPSGPLTPGAISDLDAVWNNLSPELTGAMVAQIGHNPDPRLGWVVSDLLRFLPPGSDLAFGAVSAFERLTGARLADDPVAQRSPWQSMTDHLIAWDLPAFGGYVDYKARLFTQIDNRWQPFFDDRQADIDWRWVSWGGVLIDDRPLGDPHPCRRGCIPALDDPAVTDAAGGSWYAADGIVFAVVIGDEARAYPRHIMEIHEMINDTLGGRRIGMPYCTLCGSAQVFFTDDVPDGVSVPILRTSGLLSRSNKVMYDRQTASVFNTFTGEAVSGPLRRRGVVLNQATVVTTTWGEWKAAHPETTIVASDGGIGRSYPLDPLRGRDDRGPIFPVGDVDERLAVHDQVFGVVTDDGTPVAFAVDAAIATLAVGGDVALNGVTLRLDGGGLRATDAAGNDIEGHQSFWFAWSQFMGGTLLWTPAQ